MAVGFSGLGAQVEAGIPSLSCTQAQAVTLTVAQAFQMALDLWEAAHAGRRNFSDVSLCTVLESVSLVWEPVLGCVEGRCLADWLVKHCNCPYGCVLWLEWEVSCSLC